MKRAELTKELIETTFEYCPEIKGLKDLRKNERAGSIMKTGYRQISFKGVQVPEHYLVWFIFNGEFPAKLFYIDEDRDNCVIDNLSISKNKEITKEFLLEIFDYNKDEGTLFHRKDKMNIGKRAGTKSSSGYRHCVIQGTFYQEHHLIWCIENGYLPKELDHKDQVKTNNRIGNLRPVNRFENMQNIATNTKSKYGCFGISPFGIYWDAKITANGNAINIGRFETKLDAMLARKQKEKELNFHENHNKITCKIYLDYVNSLPN